MERAINSPVSVWSTWGPCVWHLPWWRASSGTDWSLPQDPHLPLGPEPSPLPLQRPNELFEISMDESPEVRNRSWPVSSAALEPRAFWECRGEKWDLSGNIHSCWKISFPSCTSGAEEGSTTRLSLPEEAPLLTSAFQGSPLLTFPTGSASRWDLRRGSPKRDFRCWMPTIVGISSVPVLVVQFRRKIGHTPLEPCNKLKRYCHGIPINPNFPMHKFSYNVTAIVSRSYTTHTWTSLK